VVDEQAKRATGVPAREMDLGANIAGHPHHLRLRGHVCDATSRALRAREAA
jgi:hypothetical protein